MSIFIRSAIVAAALIGGATAALAHSTYTNYTVGAGVLSAKAFFEKQQSDTSR